MKSKYKPKLDKLFFLIFIPTSILMILLTLILAFDEPSVLFFMIPVDILVFYFLISPLCGYVELFENAVFIKFGFFLSREIPYSKILTVEKARKFYSDSMLSLKNSLEHVNIKYNRFDVCTVSVKENDEFIEALKRRILK
jgi:hypothetical protein